LLRPLSFLHHPILTLNLPLNVPLGITKENSRIACFVLGFTLYSDTIDLLPDLWKVIMSGWLDYTPLRL